MIINSINSSSPVIFTVEQSSYDTDFTATGLAIRKETLVTAKVSGMPYYYVRDGQKVSKSSNLRKNTVVFSCIRGGIALLFIKCSYFFMQIRQCMWYTIKV